MCSGGVKDSSRRSPVTSNRRCNGEVTNVRAIAPLPSAFAAGIAFASAIAVTALAVAAGATHHPVEALLPLTLVTAAVSGWTSWAGAVATAWICWALDSGFVLGREAQLSFSAASQQAMLVLVAVALLGGVGGRAVRRRRARSIDPAGQLLRG